MPGDTEAKSAANASKGTFHETRGGSVAKFDFSHKIEFLVAIDSMTYRIPQSSKTNFATEPQGVPLAALLRAEKAQLELDQHRPYLQHFPCPSW